MNDKNTNAHLWPLEPVDIDGEVRCGLRLERTGFAETTIWYQVPAALAGSITDRCDPWLIAVLFHLMQAGSRVHVHGPVTQSLVDNLYRLVEVVTCWWPDKCKPIEIDADAFLPDRKARLDESIMLYSGGVDARSAFHWHRLKMSRQYIAPITHALLVRGLNIRLDEERKYLQAFDAAVRSLTPHGVPVHKVSTNWFNEAPLWPISQTGLLGSLLQLFEGTFASGVFGSSSTYRDLEAWGSHPLLDERLGSGSMPIRVDDYSLGRLGKCALLAGIKGATDDLLVCHYFKESGNCGQCEKCLRTALCFIALNLPVPAALNIAEPVDRSVATRNMGYPNFQPSLEVVREALRRFHSNTALRRTYPRIYRRMRTLIIRHHSRKLLQNLPLLRRLGRYLDRRAH